MKVLARIIIALGVASSTTALADPYDLRGLKLGMTLREFRATPYPDPAQYVDGKLVCTGGPEGSGLTYEGLNAEQKAGQILCHYITTRKIPTGTQEVPAVLDVAGIKFPQDYEFLATSPDIESARLMRITLRTRTAYWDDLWTAYNSKFGKPSERHIEKDQTRFGAVINTTVATWANKESAIVMRERYIDVDDVTIVYTHKELERAFNQRAVEIKRKLSGNL